MELEIMWKEAAMIKFWHLPGGTEKSHEKTQSG
jgi:hypothetical protein